MLAETFSGSWLSAGSAASESHSIADVAQKLSLSGITVLCYEVLTSTVQYAERPWVAPTQRANTARKGKERRAFLLLALEASWPIGEAPSPRTLGDSSEGDHPISEDASRLLGREQLASRGKHRYMRGDGKPHQIHHPNPPSTESVWRHWDSNHRPHRSKVAGASLTSLPLVTGVFSDADGIASITHILRCGSCAKPDKQLARMKQSISRPTTRRCCTA
jgi:hypothetical protein